MRLSKGALPRFSDCSVVGMSPRSLDGVLARKKAPSSNLTADVQAIINDVRENGDKALFRYAEKFDGFKEQALAVTPQEYNAATIDPEYQRILERTAERIADFHKNQIEKSWSVFKEDGVIMGQMVRPLERVAVYVPGGTAVLVSSLLMCAVPAQLAGVKEIFILTPVKEDGKVSDKILQAAAVCGITEIYKVGGVHGIAAAAYGTESIAKADKIVGPGNSYVAAAKRLVYGDVDIDMVAGPSDVLIIADETANPKYVAADLLSQAEHGADSSSILVTTSERLITETEAEIERQMSYLKRTDYIQKSLTDYGAAVLVESLQQAFDIANEIAPEHLEILTADPLSHLPKVKNAGSIFLGENTPEPLGDYMSGTNHVLPTDGTARFYSGLGVYSFVKYSSYSYYPREALAELQDDVIAFALSEELDAHANSVKVRF